jgi:hypothetical protein
MRGKRDRAVLRPAPTDQIANDPLASCALTQALTASLAPGTRLGKTPGTWSTSAIAS